MAAIKALFNSLIYLLGLNLFRSSPVSNSENAHTDPSANWEQVACIIDLGSNDMQQKDSASTATTASRHIIDPTCAVINHRQVQDRTSEQRSSPSATSSKQWKVLYDTADHHLSQLINDNARAGRCPIYDNNHRQFTAHIVRTRAMVLAKKKFSNASIGMCRSHSVLFDNSFYQ